MNIGDYVRTEKEIKKEIEELEERKCFLEYLECGTDRFTENDRKHWEELSKRIKELKEELEKLGDEENE